MTQNFKETEIGMIPEDWSIVKFKEILIDGTKNGIYKKKEFHGRGSKIVNMGELFAYPRLHSVPMKRLELTDSEVKNFSLKENDLLFARRSLVAEGAGKCSIVREINEPTVFESSIIRARPNSKKTNSLYLYYLFNSTYGLYLLNTIRRQVAVAGITGKDLQNLQIPLPSLPEQDAIANVLSSLDDKIELNRQINSTLEQIAQALFKRWFIDFEFPDENGNLYRSSGGKMVDSELGEIPEGWDVKTIDSVAKKVAMGPFGSNIKVSTFVEKGVPIISGQHLHETLLTESAYNYITEEHARKLANSCVSTGDVIFTHAGNIGQVSLIPSTTKYSKYIISQRQFYLRPDTKQITSSYLVYFFRSHTGQHLLLANASQVGVPSISRPSSYLKSIKIIVPGKPVLKQFEIIIEAFAEQIVNNREEIDSLVTTRDTLLPKLMSGKIRIDR